MEWHQLEYFRTVGQLQNVTRAAERLRMTQPALSRSIARLERELGVSLFEHAGRNVRLTRFGEAFLPQVDRALRALDDGRRALADLSGITQRTIALGFIHTLGSEIVPRFVRGFKARCPDVRFDFHQNAGTVVLGWLATGELDLVLTSGPPDNPNLAWTPLANEEMLLIVPRGHRLAARRAVVLREASEETFIAYKPRLATRELSDELCRRAGFTPQITFEGEEGGTIGGFVAAELGVAIVPASIPHTRGTVRLHITEPLACRSIGIAWAMERYLPAAARAFRDFVVATGMRPIPSA
jgi:DNA-binding transcriptional LysR family regulator